MNVMLKPSKLCGAVSAIPSKSMAHRLLICAALSEGTTKVKCPGTSEDIEATVACLRAMGSRVLRIGDSFLVPKIQAGACDLINFDCRESGTTLRFMMCIAAGLGLRARFDGSDRLFERPLTPLIEVLNTHGVIISRDERGRIIQSGRAFLEDFEIRGDVSSQYISGLLMMLPLCFGKRVKVTGDFQSKPYVSLTCEALRLSGLEVSENDNTYSVSGKYDLKEAMVEGDWSNGAFFLCTGALGSDVRVKNLLESSLQGDKRILSVLENFGAAVKVNNGEISVLSQRLKATTVDVRDIPDLVPVIAVVAAVAEGQTKIINAGRLRLKESDRLLTVCEMINSLGGNAKVDGDSLIIEGVEKLKGGEVNAYNDHRIAMSAAIASTVSECGVKILGAQAVNKSYPKFFEDFQNLGGAVLREE